MRDEIVIAGAGPAGSIAALLLARAGCRVRLLDRATFPRDKLCGDTINPGTLDILRRLGIGGSVTRAGIPIRGMVVTGAGGARVCGEYGRGSHGVSLLRRDLDWMLVQHAVQAGVSFEPGVLVQEPLVQVRDGRPRVTGVRVVSSGGAAHDLPAALTIAADGRHSRLAFQLGIAHHPASPRRWAIGGYFDDVACRAGFGEMHIRCGQYPRGCSRPRRAHQRVRRRVGAAGRRAGGTRSLADGSVAARSGARSAVCRCAARLGCRRARSARGRHVCRRRGRPAAGGRCRRIHRPDDRGRHALRGAWRRTRRRGRDRSARGTRPRCPRRAGPGTAGGVSVEVADEPCLARARRVTPCRVLGCAGRPPVSGCSPQAHCSRGRPAPGVSGRVTSAAAAPTR